MNINIKTLTERRAWNSLAQHSNDIRGLSLRDFFAKDPKRGEHFIAEAAGIFLDYCKNRITETTIELLRQLAVGIQTISVPS